MRSIGNALLVAVALVGCQKPVEQTWAFQGGSGSRGNPTLTKDMVLFGNEAGYLSAVDRTDGSLRWRFATSKEVVGGAAVDGRHAFFGSTNYSLYGVDLATGRSIWEVPTHDRIKGTPVVSDGLVYAGSYDGHVYAIGEADHRIVWQYPAEAAPPNEVAAVPPATGKDHRVVPASAAAPAPAPKAFSYARLLAAEGVVYAGNLDGGLYALDAKTGALRWRFATGDGITSSPLLDRGVLYFGSNDHRVYALSNLGASAPSVGWTFQTGDQVNAGPILAGGTLFVGGTDHVFYALDAATGKKLWSTQLAGPVFGRAAAYQNLVFVGAGAGDGTLYAFDQKTGHLFWKYDGGTKIQSDLAIDGDRLYVVTGDGQLLAFQIHKTTNG